MYSADLWTLVEPRLMVAALAGYVAVDSYRKARECGRPWAAFYRWVVAFGLLLAGTHLVSLAHEALALPDGWTRAFRIPVSIAGIAVSVMVLVAYARAKAGTARPDPEPPAH